ncbi:hypothetical protein HYH02_010258 [Chlamydomonas schloesseri]|uniref:Calpain catalytic domain-containing protein n=1 Tax=Chlamydomonas schloesseri TaxID=2026947 RepID=A0A835T8B9_9CHLO|nr:hypothetical protein HYH02_010258 [Chlamydomonas schloesseri]|eukprot:KAG2440679.1 hypothetical protein HYH02_010258 [Chlamydomonas schloesseri]
MSFLDPDFPADERSICEVTRKGVIYKGAAVNDVVAWRRLKDLQSFQKATDGKQHVRLFEDGIEAADINQGQLGNCGLLSALACLATRPGGVEELFLTPEYNEEGRYQLRLWDRARKQFREITIDDRIPVWKENGLPCFARPNGNEAWVLLLEKAVAKWAGGYDQLRGGHASWWLQALTGHYTCVFALGSKYGPNRAAGEDRAAWRWLRQELGDKVGALSYREDDPNKFFTQEEMFMAAEYHLSIGNLVAAASEGASDSTHLEGVVRNHAYTVLAARLVAAAAPPPPAADGAAPGGQQQQQQQRSLMMVQVRNPHGSGGREWTGDWSDTSPLWGQHPEVGGWVAAALAYTPPSAAAPGTPTDGCFWMNWPDFARHFHNLIFCCAKGFDYVDEEGAGSPRVFQDSAFPHDHTSLGPDFKLALAAGRSVAGPELDSSGSVVWLRLRDLAAAETFRVGARGLKLFAGGGTHPDDIDGGSGGLMVAAACLANRPGVVEELFLSGSEYRSDGEYQLRLFDPAGLMAAPPSPSPGAVGAVGVAAAAAAGGSSGGGGGAQLVTIDDWIPCFGAGFAAAGRPLTGTRILGAEVWVLLLEKAVAKFVGSYRKLRDCLVPWALAALSGQYTCMLTWQPDKQRWRREELSFKPGEPGSCGRKWAAGDSALIGSDELFGTFATQLLLGCCIAAETDREDVATEATGLAKARYYSVLDARCVKVGGQDVRLIKLRDPARTHEWKGDWSDTSALWDAQPEVAAELEFQREPAAVAAAQNGGDGAADAGPAAAASTAALPGWGMRRDGAFWMPWQDFLTHFRKAAACGNSLRGAARPWAASEEELQRAARKLQRLRAALKKRAEHEALEESRHQEEEVID